MSNPLKYSTSTPTGALRHATLGAGVVSAQYDENWNSGATPNTLTTYYLVYEPVNGTAVRVYAPANAAELIKLAKSKGSSETTEAGALTWLSANGYYPANKILENIVTDDLDFYVDSRTSTSYPRSGTAWLDLSGEGEDGTLVNGVAFDEDSESLVFDGVDDEVNTSDSAQLGDFTVTVVFKNDSSAAWGRLVDKGYQTGFFVSSYFASFGSGYVGCGIIEPSSPHGVALQYNTSRWHSFTSVRNGTAQTIYLDGISNTATRTVSSATLNNTTVSIGAWSGGTTSQRFTGDISKVLIHSKALTTSEIAQNYFQGPITTNYMTYAFDASNLVSFEPGETSVYSLTGSLGAASDGTLGNGVGFSDIANGNWVFDGVDDKLTLAANINLGNGNVAWTVEAWVKSTTAVNGLGQGSVASNDGSGPVYSMMGINANKMVYWTYQSGWVQYLGNKTINDGNWHHLTWVNYTNYTMDMYVDGVFDRNVGNSTSGNNNPIDTIGNSWSSRFDGDIASVYFYQGKSLSAAEVNQNYQAKIKKYT